MAMKPAGRAIIVGLVAVGAAAGIHYSGILKAGPVATPVNAPNVAPVAIEPVARPPQEPPVAQPAPPTAAPPAESNSAFDALIRQSGTK